MIKKFLAKLVGKYDMRRDPKDFHRPEVIAREEAKEHVYEVGRHERERLEAAGERELPSDEDVLGPSDSGSKEA